MVTKKSLKAQIDFLIDKIDKMSDENRSLQHNLDYLTSQFKMLESNYEDFRKISNDRQNKFSEIVSDLSEKVEFVYRKTDSLTVPQGTLFDEWMNGAQKEGEN
jgi:chromosome segregation ATPase